MLDNLGSTSHRKKQKTSESSFKSRLSNSFKPMSNNEQDGEDLIASLSVSKSDKRPSRAFSGSEMDLDTEPSRSGNPNPVNFSTSAPTTSDISEKYNSEETTDKNDQDEDEEEEEGFTPLVAGAVKKNVGDFRNQSSVKLSSAPKTPTKNSKHETTSYPVSDTPSPSQLGSTGTSSLPTTPAPSQSKQPNGNEFFADLEDDDILLSHTLLGAETADLSISEARKSIQPQLFLEHKAQDQQDSVLRFFWTDYHDFGSKLGLYGKVKNNNTGKFVSAFVVVENIQRELYVMPNIVSRSTSNSNNGSEETPKSKRYGFDEVLDELTDVLNTHKINSFRSKVVEKKYCFELPDVPKKTEYLKVLYSYSGNPNQVLPSDIQGRTFGRVFGTHTNIFEQFVLDKNIMGPCWLELKNPNFDSIRNASWCQVEVSVETPFDVSVAPESLHLAVPPLTVMSISLRTVMDKKSNKQEVVAISARIYKDMDHDTTEPVKKLPCSLLTYVRPISGVFPTGFTRKIAEGKTNSRGKVLPNTVRTFDSESALLSEFLSQLERFDPDVLVGHALENIHFNILTHRLKDLRIMNWSRVGRRKENKWPDRFGSGNDMMQQRLIASGRLLLDISNTYGQSLTSKCDSWTLNEMATLYAEETRLDQPLDARKSDWVATAGGLYEYLQHNECDTYLQMKIAFKTQMLALSKQLTNIAGNSWARVLTGTRVERNEYILLHEFYRQDYLLPDKYSNKKGSALQNKTKANGKKASQVKSNVSKASGTEDASVVPDEENLDDPTGQAVAPAAKKKNKYQGGLVLEPERGLYDKIVLVMDFNSLYPSIIQEFNICFTTIDRRAYNSQQLLGEEVDDDVKQFRLPDKSIPLGIFPRLIQSLVDKRRAVKNMMKSTSATDAQRAQWDIKQQALKLTANSMYGCLGFEGSRFYARPLAALTTHNGREILMATKQLAESQGLRVIYGDTDSVMINTNVDSYEEAIKIGNDFKRQVNQNYKLLEIDIDNVFRRMLLHSKKKYAAVSMHGPEEITSGGKLDIEVKGLDMKRREYCAMSKLESKYALDQILGSDSAETAVENIHEHLRDLAQKVRDNKVALAQYIIRNRLGKNPKDYPGGANLPHVVVAQRMIDRGEIVKVDEVISYVIVTKTEPKHSDGDEDVEMGDANGALPEGLAQQKKEADEFNTKHFAQRAFTTKEINDAKGEYRPDVEYYLSRQILPPLERLVAPISGTDGARIADCLGLDLRKYVHSSNSNGYSNSLEEPQFELFQTTIPDAERFRHVASFVVQCRCGHMFKFGGMMDAHMDQDNSVTPQGVRCPACLGQIAMTRLNAQLEAQIRSEIQRYYSGWMVCRECHTRTRTIGAYPTQCLHRKEDGSKTCGGTVHQEYSDLIMYNQLVYYNCLFDVDRAKSKAERRMKLQQDAFNRLRQQNRTSASLEKLEALVKKASNDYYKVSALAEQNRNRFAVSQEVVDKYMSQNARRYVNMGEIFGQLYS